MGAAQARAESDDIAALIKKGKITNAAQLTAYENSWNYITGHAKDANDAHSVFTSMIQSGAVVMGSATKGGPAFIAAWEALVKKGINPADISASEIATQMNVAAVAAQTWASNLAESSSLMSMAHSAMAAGNGTAAAAYAKEAALNRKGLASGGMITETIVGYGLTTGTQYT